jgi:hypothetical protein|tara:strand:- start:381 stop:611 length:231 start_codon:yes stop_codon:yes gene_type:complete
MLNKIKGLQKFTDCSMPKNIGEVQERRDIEIYNQAINDVIKIFSLQGVVASLPKCKNYVNGQCTECELNHHKECNG